MLTLLWLFIVHFRLTLSTDSPLPVIIVPQHLNFGNCNLGYVTTKNISIYNNADRDVILTTVYDSRSVFQPRISRSKTVLLDRNQRYELSVMFLPHALGEVTETFQLFIHMTSKPPMSSGTVPKDVIDIRATGTGQENPFRLAPLVGVKWPTSVQYAPLLKIYNPFETELKVQEVYVSGGEVSLVPPFNFNKASSWSILPYETKPIVRLNLFSDKSYNHLSYVTVRLGGTDNLDIKLPIEVDLVSTANVFCTPTHINFGSFSRDSGPVVVSVFLLSTHNSTTNIFSITTNSILHQNGISIKLLREGIPQAVRGSSFQKVADVTIEPSKLPELADKADNEYSGNILIKFSNANVENVDIPFTARVYPGSLALEGFGDGFYSGPLPPRDYVKQLHLTNHYEVPVAVMKMDLEPLKSEFLIEDLKFPFVIQPGESFDFAKFTLKRQGHKFNDYFVLKMETNLTQVLEFPIPVYSGDVDVTIDDKPLNVLNFELLGYNQTRVKIVRLHNKNPVNVGLLYYFTNVPFCDGYYSNLWRDGIQTMIPHKKEDSIQHQLVELRPRDFIELTVTITTPSVAHNVSGFFVIETNYDFVQLPLTFRTLEGGLLTPHIEYEEVFPGMTNAFNLKITNTFNETFPIEDISLESNGMFKLIKKTDKSILLKPLSSSDVGTIEFHPEKDNQYSYLMTDDIKKQKEFFKGNRLNFDQVDYELKLFKHLKGKWNTLQKNGKHKLVINGSVKSSFSDNSPISTTVDLTWPSFVQSRQPMPVTHVKSTSTSDVKLVNPSSYPVHIEVFLISSYPHSRALIDILGMRQEAVNVDAAYSLQDTSTDFLDKFFNSNELSRSLKSLVLKPGEERTVKVQFSPQFVGLHKNILVIRNNLTLFEPVLYSAHAAKGELVFEKKQFLPLNVHENVLSDCHHAEEGSINRGFFNVNRSFTLKNIGDIKAKVEDILINGISCSAYGITVFNCDPFEVEPFATYTLNFNFIPNFHYSYIEYTLTIVPSAGDKLEIPLITKVPAHMLEVCADKIERPIWEVSFRFLLITGAMCMIVVVFVQSYMLFSQPIVISPPGLKPVIIHKTTDLHQHALKHEPIPTKKTSKKVDKASKQVEVVAPVAKKKKSREASKVKDTSNHHVEPVKHHVTQSPKVSKRKVSTPKPESPKIESVQPKPEKMTNFVKPRIKEVIKESPAPVKKQKDVNIVKPEPKRTPSLNNTPSITESKYRLSNKLTAAAEIDTSPPQQPTDHLQLEQKFAAAVQEEQKRKNQLTFNSLYHQTPNSWSGGPPGVNSLPKLDGNSLLPPPTTLPISTSSSSLFQPPLSVDDWFAPDAQTPFTTFNLLNSSRQTSRFQSMFSDNSPAAEGDNWNGIWGPLRLDTGLDEQSWKTD